MFSAITDYFDWVNTSLEAAIVGTIIDTLILLIAAIPVLYIAGKLLFGDAAKAQVLTRSPQLRMWLLCFCCIEFFLHILKAPIALKVFVLIVFIILLPFFLIFELINVLTP